jgi:hypothetical protein
LFELRRKNLFFRTSMKTKNQGSVSYRIVCFVGFPSADHEHSE